MHCGNMFLTSNIVSSKNMSPISILLLFLVEKLACLNQERNMYRSNTVDKQKQSKMTRQKRVEFFTRKSVMDYGLVFFSRSNDLI